VTKSGAPAAWKWGRRGVTYIHIVKRPERRTISEELVLEAG
jgi:hypothetical protein